MTGKSQIPREILLDNLQELMPEIFTEGKIDWERLKATMGEDINFSNERYVLNWAGKSDAFRVLQSPSTKTLVPAKEESINFDDTENIFIEGENLEVLKVLQKSYFGKVKMIYIDPPYNTGNDSFIYADKFSESKKEYQKRIGDKDEDGYMTKEGMYGKNSKENGQYHSNWLNMMYPRLYLAKNLLRDDGMIFVSIDDNEVHNLRLLMNEIFDEENFVGQIVWKNKYGAGAKTKGFIEVHEYILCYSKYEIFDIELKLTDEQIQIYGKNKDDKYSIRGGYVTQPLMTNSLGDRKNLQYTIEYKGEKIEPRKQWVWERGRLEEAIKNNEVVFKKMKDGTYSVRAKVYLKDKNGNIRKGKPLSLLNGPFNQNGTKEVADLVGNGVFSFPKPSELLKFLFGFIINNIDDNSGFYLDFFSGSGTAAQAIYDLNKEDNGTRRYLCVQLPELCKEGSEAFKAGLKTISEIAKFRIRRLIEKISKESAIQFEKSNQDLGFKVLKLANSNFKICSQQEIKNEEELVQQMKIFVDPVSEEARIENMVYELLLKSGFEINSKIEHINKSFIINTNEMILLLEEVNENIIDEALKRKPVKIIALDKLFKGNDQLKTNTALQMKDAGIDFKTI